MEEPKQTEPEPQPQVVSPERLGWIKENWLEFQERHIANMVKVLTEGVIPPLLGPIMQGYQSLLLTIDERDAQIADLEQEVESLKNKLALLL